jgi:hypothetical protein
MKTIFGALASAAALSVITLSTALSQTTETLQSRCAQKTIVYNRDGVKIAEAPNDYCLGFLEGTLTAMQRANIICPERPPDGSLLLSVFSTFVNDQKQKGIDAAEAIAAAYQRAFPCKK